MPDSAPDPTPEPLDVIIVGAGLSGIGAAARLQRDLPELSVAVLESRDAIGGTWDLFRYPGVRSDSDMFTLGYAFVPWRSATAIADGASILRYIRDTARAEGVDRLIRFSHRVTAAHWDSAAASWTIAVAVGSPDGDHEQRLSCRFLWFCSGYYRYDQGYTPAFPGAADFTGPIVHPQHWPEHLDWTGRRVVVIGSGATAVTLVPALAERAAQVIMVQRSPSYVAPLPATDRTAQRLAGRLPARWAYAIVRVKKIIVGVVTFRFSRRRPEQMRELLRQAVVSRLPAGFDVDVHFNPRYAPWDQRLCVAPDGDLFTALRTGRAEIVTDTVVRFLPEGVELGSGRVLPADVIITATGLNLRTLGDITLEVDGVPVDPAETVAYKGMMLSGVPNLALTLGYTNASWTLKADLVARYVVRLLRHLRRHRLGSVTPVRPALATDELSPLIDLHSGYVLRSVASLPRQGPRPPWRLHQNYLRDFLTLRLGRLTNGVRFTRARPSTPTKGERPCSTTSSPAAPR